MTVVLIDNYDSFTYNLVALIESLNVSVRVFKNDDVCLSDVEDLRPSCLFLSPGPSTPDHAGITLECIRYFSRKIPIMGVCLGHQAIGQAFGGKIVRSAQVTHGRAVSIHHQNSSLFENIPSPYQATRYNSLTVDRRGFPDCLEILATEHGPEGEIMALRHRQCPVFGVQFHPESVLSEYGRDLFRNFFNIVGVS